jgi:hypothetical protein
MDPVHEARIITAEDGHQSEPEKRAYKPVLSQGGMGSGVYLEAEWLKLVIWGEKSPMPIAQCHDRKYPHRSRYLDRKERPLLMLSAIF